MAGVYKGLRIEISADDGDLQRALNRNQKEATRLQRELKSVERNLKFNSKSPEMLAQKMQKIGLQVTNTEAKLKLLKQAEREIGRAKMSTQQWTELQGDIAACEARIKAYKAQLKELTALQAANASGLGQMGGFLANNAETFTKVGTGMQTVGRTLTHTVTPAIALAAAGSVKAAVDIDSALTGVKKTVDGTSEEFEKLKENAIEFSKTSAVSATDILQAEELGGQLGVAKENLEAFAKVTTSLDIATNMNVEDASSEMARFFNVTKQVTDESKSATEQYEAYGNVIVGLGNNLATTESEISAFSLRMASAGALAGMSQAEIMGIGGAMSSLGLEAEAGGTAFSRTITQIGLAVSKGGEEVEGFARIAGMSAEEFSQKWKDDAAGAFTDFIVGLAEGNEAGEDMNLMLEDLGITAIRQSDAMRRLAGNTDLVKEAIALATQEWENGNAMSKEVENRNDSLAAKFEMLKNRIIAITEEVGVPIAEAMLDAVDAAQPLFEALENGARAFADMSDEEQLAVLKTVGFIAVLGPMTTGLGKIVTQIGPLGEGMQSLAKGFAKVDMLGMAADAGEAAEAIEGVGTASKAASVGMGALKTAGVLALVAGLAVAVKQAKDYYDHIKLVEKATDGVADAMKSAGDKVGRGAFSDAAEGVQEYKTSLDELKQSQEDALQANANLADSISEAFSGQHSGEMAIDTLREAMGGLQEDSHLTEEELANLKIAVEQVNDQFGTAFEVTGDAEQGYSVVTESAQEAAEKIDELRSQLEEDPHLGDEALGNLQEAVARVNEQFGTTYEVAGNAQEGYEIVGQSAQDASDQVLNLLDSMQHQNQYETFQGLAKESSEALQTASENLAKQQMALAEAEKNLAEAEAEYNGIDDGPVLAAAAAVEQLKQDVADAEATYNEAAGAADTFASAQNLMMQATDATASSLTKAIADNDLLINSFVAAEKDIGDFKVGKRPTFSQHFARILS